MAVVVFANEKHFSKPWKRPIPLEVWDNGKFQGLEKMSKKAPNLGRFNSVNGAMNASHYPIKETITPFFNLGNG